MEVCGFHEGHASLAWGHHRVDAEVTPVTWGVTPPGSPGQRAYDSCRNLYDTLVLLDGFRVATPCRTPLPGHGRFDTGVSWCDTALFVVADAPDREVVALVCHLAKRLCHRPPRQHGMGKDMVANGDVTGV